MEAIEQSIKQRITGVSAWVQHIRVAASIHIDHLNPVLIEGESGAGKEFLARTIHDLSTRHIKPFITLTCWPVIEPALESLLFGSANNKLLNIQSRQHGLVDMARGGTLYLNLCATIPEAISDRIMHLIASQEFYRVGTNTPVKSDVRIIIGQVTYENRQEHDNNALTIGHDLIRDRLQIPPLRERIEDILPLSRHFLKEIATRDNREVRELSDEALEALLDYQWPGNIAELKKCIEYAATRVTPPAISPDMLPPNVSPRSKFNDFKLPQTGIELDAEIKRLEVSALRSALRQSLGNQTRAAELLGMKITTLHAMIKRYKLDLSEFRSINGNF